MTQDFSKVLNRMQERTDVAFGEWWVGSFRHGALNTNLNWLDGYDATYGVPNMDADALYEESLTFTHGNGICFS